MEREVPVIDLSPYLTGRDKGAVAREVAHACETIGFLIVKNHGVPPAVIDRMADQTKALFALPQALKATFVPSIPGAYRGYAAAETKALARSRGVDSPPDLREAFTINRVSDKTDPYFQNPAAGTIFADNVWPDETILPGFRTAYTDYYEAMEALTADLMRIFALALDLPEPYFDTKVDKHFSNMTVFHYPPLATPPKPGQLRGGAHTDFGSMTLVYGMPAIAGLQVATGSEWRDVPTIPDTFVVNLGDLMAQWTNDKWVSTLHRVTNPTSTGWDTSRYSAVFFHQPNYDVLIESLDAGTDAKYPPVTSGQHLLRKMAAMHVTR